MRGVRVLLAVTIGMGVLIVAGVVALAVVVVQRGTAGPVAPTSLSLREPAGTRIAGASLGADRVAVQLNGGGPDRVVVVDLKTGRITATIGLAP